MAAKTGTYSLIGSATASGGSSTQLVMSSIPGNYTDLVLVLNVSNSANSNLVFRFNSDSTSIYSNTILNGNGTTSSTGRNTNTDKGYYDSDAYATSGFNYNAILNVMDYSNTTTFKKVLSRSNNAGTGVTAGATLYRSTSAITRIDFLTTSGTFNSGSTFKLYGIEAGNI